jgi:hypothetical protein
VAQALALLVVHGHSNAVDGLVSRVQAAAEQGLMRFDQPGWKASKEDFELAGMLAGLVEAAESGKALLPLHLHGEMASVAQKLMAAHDAVQGRLPEALSKRITLK